MKIGTISRIVKEDLAKLGELPKWVEPFTATLNEFITTVTQGLKNQLTLADNFNCTQKTLTFTHGVTLNVNTQSRFRPIGMIPIDSNGVGIDSWSMAKNQDGTAGITFYFKDGVATTKVEVTYIILF